MSSITGNVKSFVFDKNRTITFWAKNSQEATRNEIACIVGSVDDNLEVTSFSQEYTALTSESSSSFLLVDNKLFAFEKISSNSFIIVTYVIQSGWAKIFYRIGTLNNLNLTFSPQVEINRNELRGETIKIVLVNNKAHIFYAGREGELFSINTDSGTETVWEFNENQITEFAEHKIDATFLNNKLVLVGYQGNGTYSPTILIANYVNGAFITESVTLMNDVKVAGGPLFYIEGNFCPQLCTGVFFTETNKFFLSFADNFATFPA
jgi:hypothetical protein